MHHAQKGNAFVCGLSIRKILTPSPAQNSKTPASPFQRPRQSSHSKLSGKMSSYFLGGFSAYWMDPSGRWRNQSGCSRTHGWSGETWNATSSATSRPSDSALERKRRKSASVPRPGCTASCPPSREPIAHGLPGSEELTLGLLLGPFRFV